MLLFSTIIVQVIANVTGPVLYGCGLGHRHGHQRDGQVAKKGQVLTYDGGVEGPERTYLNKKKQREVISELLEDRND